MAAKIGKTMETCCKGAEHKKGDKFFGGARVNSSALHLTNGLTEDSSSKINLTRPTF